MKINELSPSWIQADPISAAASPDASADPQTVATATQSSDIEDYFSAGQPVGQTYARNGKPPGVSGAAAAPAEPDEETRESEAAPANERGQDGEALDENEQAEVRELRNIDMKVRQHEQAHLAAGAGITRGGASFSYKKGPDGQLYAVAGEVSIDTSTENTPEATIAKMKRVKAAALAPADPSPQDRRVAAAAAAKAAEAAVELAAENRAENREEPDQNRETDQPPAARQGIDAYQAALASAKNTGSAVNIML